MIVQSKIAMHLFAVDPAWVNSAFPTRVNFSAEKLAAVPARRDFNNRIAMHQKFNSRC
jgi:hypothetical protein